MVDHHHPLLASVKVSEYGHLDSHGSLTCGVLDDKFIVRFITVADLHGATNKLSCERERFGIFARACNR